MLVAAWTTTLQRAAVVERAHPSIPVWTVVLVAGAAVKAPGLVARARQVKATTAAQAKRMGQSAPVVVAALVQQAHQAQPQGTAAAVSPAT